MDVRKPGWHMAFKVSGVGDEMRSSGSILSLSGDLLRKLQTLQPRLLSSGERTIHITISDKPGGDCLSQENIDAMKLAMGVDSKLVRIDAPIEGEDVVAFKARLMLAHYPEATADYIARAHFDYDLDASQSEWISDPQAAVWRKLNSSNRSYEECDKEEYAILKRIMQERYPTELANMALRG